MTALMLQDSAGKLEIGPARTPEDEHMVAIGATSIIYNRSDGSRWGVYVDDEAPSPDDWNGRVAIARSLIELASGRVVVGVRPDDPHQRITGCLCALEWYPWAYDFYPYPLPRARAYIFARRYAGPGRTPTARERMRLYRAARRHDPAPELIWWY